MGFVTRVLMVVGAVVALGYVGLLVLVYSQQRSILYPAPKRGEGTLRRELGYRRLTQPGAPVVDVLHLPAPEGAPTVVHFHGNGEEIGYLRDFGMALHLQGLGFYAVEYPGYGAMPGSPSEEALYATAEAALVDLRALGVGPESTVLSGRSLGTGVAVEMARRGHGARLVLLAPFSSVVELAGRLFPFLPTRLLVKDRYDSAAKAPAIGIPVLLFHGEQDEVIPVELGRKLGGLFPRATVETVPGAMHNDLLERAGGERLLERIAAFAMEARPRSSTGSQ
jgi:hypothetical protein